MAAYGIEKECIVVMERKTKRELLNMAKKLQRTNVNSLEPAPMVERLSANNFTPDSSTIAETPFVMAEFEPIATVDPLTTLNTSPEPAAVVELLPANDFEAAAEQLISDVTTTGGRAVIQSLPAHMTAVQPLSSIESSLVNIIEFEPDTIIQQFSANTTETTRAFFAESSPLIFESEIPYEYEVEIEYEPLTAQIK